MKLGSDKNLDGDEGRSADAGPVNVSSTNPFEEREQTMTRPDHLHHADLEEPVEDLEREEVEKAQETSERSEVEAREEHSFKGTSGSETKSNWWRKEQPSLVKQGKNAMMSSISPWEEQAKSKAMKSSMTSYDERMTSLRTDVLSSSYDHEGLVLRMWTAHRARGMRRARKRFELAIQADV